MASPTLDTPQSNASLTEGDSYSADLAGNFSDADASDTLTYSVSGLPAGTGLSIDALTGELSGTPNANDIAAAPITVTITATPGVGSANSVDVVLDIPDAVTLPSIPVGSTNVFVDPVNGDDAYNGTYPNFRGGSQGPKKTLAGVKALDLSSVTGIYIKASTTLTGETFWNQTDFTGTAATWAVIGAYSLSGNTALRGIDTGLAKPIIQGTASRIHDYDGGNLMTVTNMVPAADASRAAFTALIGRDASSMSDAYIEVENLHLRHSGGLGVRWRELRHLKSTNLLIELCLGAGHQFHTCIDCEADNVRVTGCGGGQAWYSYSDHPAIFSNKECDQLTLRNCIAWHCWGEMFDTWHGCTNVLIEDCVSIDSNQIHYYIDSTQDVTLRRNLALQTGKGATNKCSVLQDAPAFSIQGGETFQFTTNGGSLDAATDKTKDLAIYANVGIAVSDGVVFWDQHGNASAPDCDLNKCYIFRNTFIDCAAEWDEINNDWSASDGIIRDNMHLSYEDAAHVIAANVPRGTWSFAGNAWNQATGAPGWSGDISSPGWTGDTSGFDSLHTLATWSTDLHIEADDIDAFIAAVHAKLGNPTGNTAGSGTAGAHPSTVTFASFENLDYFGNAYSANDCGAIAA